MIRWIRRELCRLFRVCFICGDDIPNYITDYMGRREYMCAECRWNQHLERM